MDGFTEKKWFIYFGDHHEGPFSLEEIQAKISQGQASATNYVWADGMPDWKLMTEVPTFESILQPPPPAATISVVPEISIQAARPSEPIQAESISIAAAPSMAVAAASAGPVRVSASSLSNQGGFTDAPLTTGASDSFKDPFKDSSHRNALLQSLLKVGVVIAILGGIGIAYNSGALNNIKAIGTLKDSVLAMLGISPIPKLDDVEPDEYEGLKSAAQAKLDSTGPQISLALSHGDLINPTIYFGTNLPDGARFDVYAEGISDSLLSQLSLNAKTQVTFNKKFGKTGTFQFAENSKAFVRGQYVIYLVAAENQPEDVKTQLLRMTPVQTQLEPISIPKGLKVIATKSYFLGGTKDAAYTQRLQEYHQKLASKAQAEITELRQMSATLDSQFEETNKRFGALRKLKKIGTAQKKVWTDHLGKWRGIYSQLDQQFSKLTADSIKNDYYYGGLYQMAQQAAQSLNKVFDLQNTFFTEKVDPSSYDIQVGEVSSVARTALETLKTKTNELANTPPSPNGLPKRDGI